MINNSVIYNSQFSLWNDNSTFSPRRKACSFFSSCFYICPCNTSVTITNYGADYIQLTNSRIQKFQSADFIRRPETFCTPCTFNPISRSRCTWCAIECCHDWRLVRRDERARNSWLFYSDVRSLPARCVFIILEFAIRSLSAITSPSRRRYRYHRHVSSDE